MYGWLIPRTAILGWLITESAWYYSLVRYSKSTIRPAPLLPGVPTQSFVLWGASPKVREHGRTTPIAYELASDTYYGLGVVTHDVCIWVGTLLIIGVQLFHPSSESWDEVLITRLFASLLPWQIKLLESWQGMLEHWHWACGECLLSIICMLLAGSIFRLDIK